MNYKYEFQENAITCFSSVQEKCQQQFNQCEKKYILLDDLFNRIRYLYDQNTDNDEIEDELMKLIKLLYLFLHKLEEPPDDFIQKFCQSGLFVEMFSSLKISNCKDYILRIICLIIKKKPDTTAFFMKRNLTESFNTFILYSRSLSPEMQICVPYYVSIFLNCISKSKENPYPFFIVPGNGNQSYLQLSCHLIEACLTQEIEKKYMDLKFPEAHKTIQKTESKIYSLFSYLLKWIPYNLQNNESSEANQIFDQIFCYISKAFELNLDGLYYKLIACLNRIWNYSYDYLMNYFTNPSIYLPICHIINNRSPIEAQQNALLLMVKLLEKESNQISAEINAESVSYTANQSYEMMFGAVNESGNNIYDKTTVYAILLLGHKFLLDNLITIDVNKNNGIFLCMIDALLSDMRYEAKNAAAFMIFVIIRISKLTFFQNEKYKMATIEKAFDVALSGDAFVLENAIYAADNICQMINAGNAIALAISVPLEEFITTMYETNDDENLSEKIEFLYNHYIKNQ